jgi:hypothetical protein
MLYLESSKNGLKREKQSKMMYLFIAAVALVLLFSRMTKKTTIATCFNSCKSSNSCDLRSQSQARICKTYCLKTCAPKTHAFGHLARSHGGEVNPSKMSAEEVKEMMNPVNACDRCTAEYCLVGEDETPAPQSNSDCIAQHCKTACFEGTLQDIEASANQENGGDDEKHLEDSEPDYEMSKD